MADRCYADVHGYELAVPDAWYDILDYERSALQNGIGPDRWPPLYCQLLDGLTGFHPAADVHDVDYCLGRTREDRLAADRRFWWNCLRIVLADLLKAGIWQVSWRKVLARLLLARALYRALRLRGQQAFVVSTKLDLRVRGQAAVTEYDDLYEGEV